MNTFLKKLPMLRDSVQVSTIENGIQLTDVETGFAVEFGQPYMQELIYKGDKLRELGRQLKEMGLTSDSKDIDKIRKLQRSILDANNLPLVERLQERLLNITNQVPFFSEKKSTYDPQAINSIEDFSKLPFMRKSNIRENFPTGLLPKNIDLATGLKDGSLIFVGTSGSTEERLQIISNSKISRLPFGSDDLFNLSIGGEQPRTAILTTPICSGTECTIGKVSFEARLSKYSPDLYLQTTSDPFSIQPKLLESFCNDITKFKPLILAADPIYLQCIIRRAAELSITLPPIDIIQHGFEFGPKTALRDLSRAFKVPIFNDYGASEENRLAVQCHKGSLHVRADVVYFEIVNSAGQCAPGEVGSVAITTFDTVVPLVRYLIGDIAEWTGKVCDCGFSSWPTIYLHGRYKDMIYSNKRWVSTLDIDRAIGAPAWLDFYRVIQHEKDLYEVNVIPALGASANFPDITERLGSYINSNNIKFKEVTRFDLLPSMKIGLVENKLGGAPELL
jgi:phenylacetate-coenzyme A ligase PaaK-like adenylate-forming protein